MFEFVCKFIYLTKGVPSQQFLSDYKFALWFYDLVELITSRKVLSDGNDSFSSPLPLFIKIEKQT